ncbi:SNF-related serine/threonine-protein kinase isoform X3 [Protopterus annectens]|uniref:SNF-related serine/threonine-protein kinase isoform X3 n=1 Tax=Protopterus annectens TaxID=7888 RepID=UPI001CFB3215|nr:SNF-related serine/threonine-protein kinase isoform X3 [Protopterus annectens]
MAGFKRGYDGKIAGLYDMDKTLGRGHFAVVKLARHVFTGEKVAVKVIDKTKLDTLATGHLFQEVRCMKLVQHPNIVRLYEVIDTQTKLYLILELGDGGDMFDYIMKHEEGLSEELAKKYFAQIVHAISYCHKLHVVHRDLKPENVVFFEKQGLVKLTDFGFSNKFQPGKKLTTSCGSLAYSAPEILLGDEYDAPAVDIWSLGVILFMLVCGQPPFQEANDSETLTMIMDCKYTVPTHVSKDCREALETNKYNHITATYFLLAERILREKQEKELQNRSTSPSNIKAQFRIVDTTVCEQHLSKRQSWPTKIDVPQDLEDDLTASPISHSTVPQSPARTTDSILNGHRNKASTEPVKKEDTPDLAGAAALMTAGALIKPTTSGLTCLFRVEEDEEEEEEDKKLASSQGQVVLRRKPSITNRLTSRKSAPVLNQIFEEGESDDEFDMDENLPPKLSRLKMNIASPGTVHKRYHRRKSQGRGSSCSSSETSDDDSESRRRLDKDSGFTYSWHRRDSSEGPPGNQGDGGGQGKPSNGDAGMDRSSPGDDDKGGGSPSSSSSGTTNTTSGSTRSCSASGNSSSPKCAGELIESLKLMGLCLSSQFNGSSKYIIDPLNSLSFSSVKVQEKSAWRMCINSNGNTDKSLTTCSTKKFLDQTADTVNELELIKENNMNLKNNILQLPLYEKTISVNIQRNPKDGLLCTSNQTNCCQVI